MAPPKRMAALLWLLPALAAAGEPAALGFAVEVDGSGFFLNPTVRSVKVQSVVPASPAASAGMVVGVEIIAVAGHVVPGTKARELAPLVRRDVGQTLELTTKRADGAVQAGKLVAVAKAASAP